MDKYYVYRPLLDLIGYTEGTDEKRGYNETLDYGAYTGGDVDLTSMTLAEIDKLQGKMLAHPKNKWNSSAIGRYQIVRTTLRKIKSTLKLSSDALFDKDMQDRCACYLLGVRGIDKYLVGRLSEDTMINNLSKEWASLPTTKNKGYYSGQNARVNASCVIQTLAEVKKRHKEGQPVKETVPVSVEKEVKKKTGWLSGIFGSGVGLSALVAGWDKQTLLVMLAVGVAGSALMLIAGEWIVSRIKSIRKAVEDD